MRIIRYQDTSGSIQHAALQSDGTARRVEGDIFGDFRVTDEIVTPHKLLAPLAPTAILCIGLNYRKHAEESNAAIPQYPVLFMKSPGAVQNPGDDIVLPRHLTSDEVDYECELAVVIGKACKNVSRANALDYVLGYTCANDVSARDWQIKRGGSQWCRGKTFDTFAPLGPCLVLKDEIAEPKRVAHPDHPQWQNDAGFEYERHDLRRAYAHRVPQRQHHATSRHRHPHRHTPGRRRRDEAPSFPPTRRYGDHRH